MSRYEDSAAPGLDVGVPWDGSHVQEASAAFLSVVP